MNKSHLYIVFVTVPLFTSIVVNLFINCKYGRDVYLRGFSKNYERFSNIFNSAHVLLNLDIIDDSKYLVLVVLKGRLHASVHMDSVVAANVHHHSCEHVESKQDQDQT